MIRSLFFVATIGFTFPAFGQLNWAVQDPNFTVDLIHSGNGMVPIEFGPGNRMYVGEKLGTILIFEPDSDAPSGYGPPSVFASLAAVDSSLERGLLGLAAHPNFQTTRWLYALYCVSGENQRLVRVQADATFSQAVGVPEILIDDLPNQGSIHKGGDINFWESDLYISLGDDGTPDLVQDLSSYVGKLLRVDELGRGLTTNPFYDDDNTSIRSRIWGIGCRNPFRFALHPSNGTMYVSENGNETDRVSRWDSAGANGGWPNEFLQPLDPNVQTLITSDPSLTGIAIVEGGPFADPAFPDSPVLYLANWLGGIYRWRLEGSDLDVAVPININGNNQFVDDLGKFTHIEFGPGGALYISASGGDASFNYGNLFRVKFVAGQPPKAIFATNPSPPSGSAPLAVTFLDQSTDDGSIVAWRWEFGDGTESLNRVVTRSYNTPGVYTARLTVTDDQGLTDSETVQVTVHQPTLVNLVGTVRDGRDLSGQSLATELRLYQSDGLTPLPFQDGGGTYSNTYFVPTSGAFDLTVVVELTDCGLVVSAGEPEVAGIHTAYRGVRIPCGSSTHSATLDFYLSDTVIAGQVVDTSKSPARVDLGTARLVPGSFFEVAGGRDFRPPIPLSGVLHRIESDDFGYYYIPIPIGAGGANFYIDVATDTNQSVYLPTTFNRSVNHGERIEVGVTLGLPSGGTNCDAVPTPLGPVDYTHIQGIFNHSCVGCHSGLAPNADLDLSTGVSHAALVNVFSLEVPGLKLVEPGNSDRSFLWEKINCSLPQVGTRMRPGSAMSPEEQALIRDWIDQGAPPSRGIFRRGDANADGCSDISDAVTILLHLFGSRAVSCEKSADANDSGSINIADAVFLLETIFTESPAPPDPGLRCGLDPTSDDLGCESFPACVEPTAP